MRRKDNRRKALERFTAVMIPNLKYSEIKVLSYFLKEIIINENYKKYWEVTYKELMKGTKLGSQHSIASALESLEKKGLLWRSLYRKQNAGAIYTLGKPFLFANGDTKYRRTKD